MSPGLALGLFASIAWGFVDVAGAVASRRIGSLRLLAWSQIVSLIALAVIVLADRSRLGADPAAGLLAGLPLGIGAAAAYLCYFTALRIGPLSVVSPVVVAYGGTTVVLAVLLRGESLLPVQVFGAVLATAGVVLAGVVFDGSLRGARLVGPGVLIAVVTMLLFAAITVALAAPIIEHGWLPVVVGSRLASTASAVLLLGVVSRAHASARAASASSSAAPSTVASTQPTASRFDVLMEPSERLDRSTFGLVVMAGVFDMAAFAVYAVGLEVAPTWLVGLASSFGPVIAVAYGVWRLGERPHATQWLGLALLGVGVVVLAVAG